MNRYKRPLALAIGLLSLGGCQALNFSDRSAPDTSDEAIVQQLVIDESLCTFDADAYEDFAVSDRGNLWPRLRDGYGLPDTDHARIDSYLDWYTRHPHYMERVLERGQRYLHYIANQLDAQDMPLELALLPIVESAFDPFAYSHSRASGMWQFVPATGRQYGLKQNWWYDGRRDVVASTDAAVRYLKYLHGLFDEDWLLALAAYNTGQGNLLRRIRANESQGKPTDFWSLSLPRETRAYVPQLLALSKVIADPEAFGLSLRPVPDEPYFKVVDVGSQIDLSQAAEMAEMDLDELYMLNAGYNRWATDPDGPHQLLIPVQHEEKFLQRLDELPTDQRVAWDRYRVESGDSLITIARRYRTSVDNIKSANRLKDNMIRAGQTLMIPRARESAEHYAFSADQRRARAQSRSGGEDRARLDYQVRSGDSFWAIAKRHGTTVGALTNWNGMAPGDTLRPGQTLVIWTESEQAGTQAAHSDQRAVMRKLHYRVRKGDSLARIANRFGLSVQDILSWNTVSSSSYIHPGQSLTLYVDVTKNGGH